MCCNLQFSFDGLARKTLYHWYNQASYAYIESVSLDLDKNIYIEKVFNFSVYLPWDILLTTQYPILNWYFIEERLKGSQRSWKIMSDAHINQVLSISWIKVLQINTCIACFLTRKRKISFVLLFRSFLLNLTHQEGNFLSLTAFVDTLVR